MTFSSWIIRVSCALCVCVHTSISEFPSFNTNWMKRFSYSHLSLHKCYVLIIKTNENSLGIIYCTNIRIMRAIPPISGLPMLVWKRVMLSYYSFFSWHASSLFHPRGVPAHVCRQMELHSSYTFFFFAVSIYMLNSNRAQSVCRMAK